MGSPAVSVAALLRGIAVLVVDDDPDAREIHSAMLTHAGALVFTVRTAEAALKLLERVIPDVIVSDLRMPRHDGYWLMRHVRALPPAQGGVTPAIPVTGHHPYTHDSERSADAGFNAHLTKPTDANILWHTVRRVAERRDPGLRLAPRRLPEQ